MTSPDTVERHEWLADLIETAMDNAMDVDVGTHELSKVAAEVALSAMPAQGVSVRPLEWNEEHAPYETSAVSPFGKYLISGADSLGKHEVTLDMEGGPSAYVGYIFGEREAKEKCQEHHNSLMSRWLSPAPMPVAEAARVPDMQAIYEHLMDPPILSEHGGNYEHFFTNYNKWKDAGIAMARALTQEGGE